jgi:cytochrome c peroxidase
MRTEIHRVPSRTWIGIAVIAATLASALSATETFDQVMSRMSKERRPLQQKAVALLEARYDLSDRPSKEDRMSRGKPVQEGVRAKLPAGADWKTLLGLSPEQIKERGLFPEGYMPLPFPNQPEGGMLFPKSHIDAVKKQDLRDLERYDLDFDIPDRFMPEFPAPMYLTTRPDLGDVSQGKLVTLDNYYEIFKDVINPKQLEGLRLLVTPFPQQQFNSTDDRRVSRPSLGVTCFDCHANGNTNGATHLVGDIRPQERRHRIETPTLRGVNVQRLFGSQRALKSIEDFTEFEQRAAYFDGDLQTAAKKGVNILDRGHQVHAMAELENILDFPPAPKLGWDGRLDPKKGDAAEKRGQELFFGKAQCAVCHTPPYYTDNLMHDLQAGRFFKERTVNGMVMSGDGKIKTFPLRGIKDTPPYLHDGRLLTLADTVRYFNLVLQTGLTAEEEADLVEFLKAL